MKNTVKSVFKEWITFMNKRGYNYYDSRIHGHIGTDKTLELFSRTYYFLGIRKFIEKYVTTCRHCIQSKASRHKPYGGLSPPPTPSRP